MNSPWVHYPLFAVRLLAAAAPLFLVSYSLFIAVVLNDYERATFWMVAAVLAAMPREQVSA